MTFCIRCPLQCPWAPSSSQSCYLNTVPLSPKGHVENMATASYTIKSLLPSFPIPSLLSFPLSLYPSSITTTRLLLLRRPLFHQTMQTPTFRLLPIACQGSMVP